MTDPAYTRHVEQAPASSPAHHMPPSAGWLVGLGVVMLIVGALAIAASFIATLATVAVFGLLLLVGGIAQLANVAFSRQWRGSMLHLAAGVLYLVVGSIMFARPLVSAVALTLVLGVMFFAGGLVRAITASIERFPTWGWALFSGLLSVLLGVLIGASWPSSGLWVIGLFVGIDLIFSGWSLIMLGFAARRWSHTVL